MEKSCFNGKKADTISMIYLRITALILILGALEGCRPPSLSRAPAPENASRPLTGLSVSYYPNGKKMGEASYQSGVLDGQAIAYYSNGKKKSEASYKKGVLDGKSIRWSDEGKVLGEAVFMEGVLKSSAP